MLLAVSRRPLMTRAEGLSVLHPTLFHPAGKTEPDGAAALPAALAEVADDEEAVAVVTDGGRALKTFIRHDPPHG